MLQTLGNEPLVLLSKLQASLLRDPRELIDRLQVVDLPFGSPFTEHLVMLYQLKLSRYLRGTGHPIHASISTDVVTPAMYTEVGEDPVYRARAFLKSATGTSTLPTLSDWHIKVNASYSQLY
jgi:hypothetical protein